MMKDLRTEASLSTMPNRYALAGRRALVTGSTHGIGLAVAGLFAENGARVIIHSPDQAECEKVAATISGSTPVACDLNDAPACEVFADRVKSIFQGRLDILVHNAAICPTTPFKHQSLEE